MSLQEIDPWVNKYKGRGFNILKNVKSKNRTLLAEFIEYCDKNPEQRFWQALRNWAGFSFIEVNNKDFESDERGTDTFYWVGKYK